MSFLDWTKDFVIFVFSDNFWIQGPTCHGFPSEVIWGLLIRKESRNSKRSNILWLQKMFRNQRRKTLICFWTLFVLKGLYLFCCFWILFVFKGFCHVSSFYSLFYWCPSELSAADVKGGGIRSVPVRSVSSRRSPRPSRQKVGLGLVEQIKGFYQWFPWKGMR